MAVDTAEKRLSILDFEGPAGMPGLPFASGAVSEAERLHFLWLYSGISPNPPTPGGGYVAPTYFIVNCGRMMNRRGGM